jgi:twinkle protein
MKYQSSNTRAIIEIDFTKKHDVCPECSKNRKKSKLKVLQYYANENRAYCFHCNATFFEYKPYVKEKQYTVPEWKNITELSNRAVKWFTGRMISQETLVKMKIYTTKEWMPQFDKEIEVICFPFFQDKVLKNIKYRGQNKTFKLFSGAELIFYNFDAIKENKELIIVEGEIDALTWIENKYYNVISVPNGANNNLEYLESSIELFDHIETIYIGTDVDSKGIELKDELIRRFGHEKCKILSFKECKDSNEYFCKYGGVEFKKLLTDARQIDIKGIIETDSIYERALDLYENGIPQGKILKNQSLDEFITWELSRLAIVSGRPTSGKSEFVDYVICKLNMLYEWKAAYFTPESYPLEYHYAKLHEKISGKKFNKNFNNTDFDTIFEHINRNFYYILNEDNMTLDFILDAAKIMIKKYGIKILVIDPYNVVDHQFEKGVNETQYISKFLNKLVHFSRFYQILIFLVAHPKILQKGEKPSMYTISGSAHFYNKCDYGIIVERPVDAESGFVGNKTEIGIHKVKFKHLGKQGLVELNYNYNNGRYESFIDSVDSWDNSNWIGSENDDNSNDIFNNFFEPISEMPF